MIIFRSSPIFHSGLDYACADVDPATLSASCGKDSGARSDSGDKKPAALTTGLSMLRKTPMHRDETSEKTTLSLDVAGFDEGHLSVEIDDHTLTITGERTNKLGDTFVTRRRLSLKPDTYDEDSVKATLNDGILEVVISKKAVPKARKVPISVVPSVPAESKVAVSDPTNTARSSNGADPCTPNPSVDGATDQNKNQEGNTPHSEKEARDSKPQA